MEYINKALFFSTTEIKENAFIYALTSAVTVHQITRACSHGDLTTCGCDTSQNGVTTEQGWKWGSCSDNVSYGLTYARRFLDARELNATSTNRQEVQKAMVHLHNNAAGRRVSGCCLQQMNLCYEWLISLSVFACTCTAYGLPLDVVNLDGFACSHLSKDHLSLFFTHK